MKVNVPPYWGVVAAGFAGWAGVAVCEGGPLVGAAEVVGARDVVGAAVLLDDVLAGLHDASTSVAMTLKPAMNDTTLLITEVPP
jgi:hypothetical protein